MNPLYTIIYETNSISLHREITHLRKHRLHDASAAHNTFLYETHQYAVQGTYIKMYGYPSEILT
jgi:hypothetical protein